MSSGQVQALKVEEHPKPSSRWLRIKLVVERWQPFYGVIHRVLTVPGPDEDDLRDPLAWMDTSIAWDKAHPVRYHAWRVYVHLTQPLQDFRTYISTPLRRFWKRGRHGWSVPDTWSIDHYLDRIVPEMIDHLRQHSHGWPGSPMTYEEWTEDDGILDRIAQGFRAHGQWMNMDYVHDDEHYDLVIHRPREEALQKTFNEGMKLFVEYYSHLWD